MDQVEKILNGTIPGHRKRWIECVNGKWVFSDKFFMLFESPELLKLRSKFIQLIPVDARPTE
jgi:hypothetical protein